MNLPEVIIIRSLCNSSDCIIHLFILLFYYDCLFYYYYLSVNFAALGKFSKFDLDLFYSWNMLDVTMKVQHRYFCQSHVDNVPSICLI